MAAFAALAALAACGDNSKTCGAGTVEDNGVCKPSATCGAGTKASSDGSCVPDGSVVCTDGTIFDMPTGKCVIDPNSCQGGTVLVNGKCQDPTAGLMVDLEEGPEPNGLNSTDQPAGAINLKAVGGPGVVVHGCITPFEDKNGDGLNDADIDAYTIDVNAPALIKVTVDGVNGLAGGFVGLATDPNLSSWQRFGINLTGDTSSRQIFFPKAGKYILAMADTRSLFLTGGAAGTDKTCYYATIDSLPLPTPTPLNPATGVSDKISGDLKFYSVPLGLGFNTVTVDMPQDQASGSLVIMQNGSLRTTADEANGTPASVFYAGVKAADTTTLVVDYQFNYAITPADFTVTVDQVAAQPLIPSPVTATLAGNKFASVNDANLFFFDVNAADEVDGLNLAFSIPMTGLLVDQDANTFASFSGLSGNSTFTSYKGLLRFPAPGRYYFAVFGPGGTVGQSFTATTTLTTLTPGAVTLDTAQTSQTVNAFASNPYTYDAGTTEPWQLFNATGTATGVVKTALFDASTAYGRLDTLTTTNGPQATTVSPVYSYGFAANGSGAQGQILLGGPTSFFVKVNPTSNGAAQSFALNFASRVYHDFGTVAAGTSATPAAATLVAGKTDLYFLKTAAGNRATITVTPTPGALNLQINNLSATEAITKTVNLKGPGVAETELITEDAGGYIAFSVNGTTGAMNGAYSVTVKVDPPFYGVANSATAYADACSGGTTVTLNAVGGSPANDEGLSAQLNAPAGWQYYGVAAPKFIVSSNGFISFDTTITDSVFTNTALPDPTNPGFVAPYWEDLTNVTVCSKLTGTKLTIQWVGEIYSFFGGGPKVQFQAILDSSDGSLEFVWGPNQQELGDFATIGVEDVIGSQATQVGFQQAGVITASSSKKFTKN
jgi:hypothetical protein